MVHINSAGHFQMNTLDRSRFNCAIKLGKPVFDKYYHRESDFPEYRFFHAAEMVEEFKKADISNNSRREYVNVILNYMYLFTSQKARFKKEIEPVYLAYLAELRSP